MGRERVHGSWADHACGVPRASSQRSSHRPHSAASRAPTVAIAFWTTSSSLNPPPPARGPDGGPAYLPLASHLMRRDTYAFRVNGAMLALALDLLLNVFTDTWHYDDLIEGIKKNRAVLLDVSFLAIASVRGAAARVRRRVPVGGRGRNTNYSRLEQRRVSRAVPSVLG